MAASKIHSIEVEQNKRARSPDLNSPASVGSASPTRSTDYPDSFLKTSMEIVSSAAKTRQFNKLDGIRQATITDDCNYN